MKCGGKGIVTARKNIVAAKKTATCSSTFTAAGDFLPINLATKREEKVNEFARESQWKDGGDWNSFSIDWIAIPMAVVKHNVRIVFCHSTSQLIGFKGGSWPTMGCEGGGCTKLSPTDLGSITVCGGGGCSEVSLVESRLTTVCEGAGCTEVSPSEFGSMTVCGGSGCIQIKPL